MGQILNNSITSDHLPSYQAKSMPTMARMTGADLTPPTWIRFSLMLVEDE
jgi:hypothetical protein